MQTTSRARELGGGYPIKRGHVPQISISDDNHHVTEAIGTMYDEHHYEQRDSRPLSFTVTQSSEAFRQPRQSTQDTSPKPSTIRNPLPRTNSNERSTPHTNGPARMMVERTNSFGHESGTLSNPIDLQDRRSNTTNSQFPLNDIDYESNPAAVAQELSNIQALRRISMDANAAGDPDLPNTTVAVDNVWVPARLHPDLAPSEFKTFIESRVNSMKRRSIDGSLSPGSPERQGSGGGLRRKKSMLSRQIDNSGGKGADGYQDGAERLDRKKSLSVNDALDDRIPDNLQGLEALVKDPVKDLRRVSLDTEQNIAGGEVPVSEDMPILPMVPPGNSLRRSTRTTYRRGSLRKGERVLGSKRVAKGDMDEFSATSPIVPSNETFPLAKVQTEPAPPVPPMPVLDRPAENFSRPGRRRVVSPDIAPRTSLDDFSSPKPSLEALDKGDAVSSTFSQPHKRFVSQIASNGRSTAQTHVSAKPIPQIVETAPPPDEAHISSHVTKQTLIPERVSSHEPPPSVAPQSPANGGPLPARGGKRPVLARQNQSDLGRQGQNEQPNQTLKDMASHPSPLPGNSTRTDSLSFIPTLTEDKKADNKKHVHKKDNTDGSRKSSWSWGSLLGNEEKEKERRKEDEAKEARRVKSKLAKPVEKSHDNTRLDVLQNAMEGGRGRESLVLDRGDLKLEEERKKESSRKASGGDKKEKDPGLFSSIFGGKKKNERESLGKKNSPRGLSPDPPRRILKPDVDYNWTRFSILEERAIYRMAHTKLANPKRALYSQVLLSNFMYSYLAKVQQMHPQIQMPQTAAQKAQQRMQQQSQSQRRPDQPEEFHQYQMYQEQQQQQEQAQAQALTQSQHHNEVSNYGDDLQTYDYDHTDHDNRHRPQSRASQHSTHSMDGGNSHHVQAGGTHYHRPQQSPYQYQRSQLDEPGRSADDDMW